MDKNFISVDDLVRQRLGGGEERAQAGSWMRMRELLDKEMPQEPVGFNWRRMFSALALLLLATTVGIGGYELSANKNGTADNVIAAANATPVVATAPANNSTANITTTNTTVTSNNQSSITANKNNNNNNEVNTTLSSTTAVTTATVEHKKTTVAHKKHSVSNNTVNKNAETATLLVANDDHKTTTEANKTVTTPSIGSVNSKEAAATDNSKINNSKAGTNSSDAKVTANDPAQIAASTKTNVTGDVASTDNKSADNSAVASVSNVDHKKAHTRNHSVAVKTQSMNQLALSGSINTQANNNATPQVNTKATGKHKKTATAKLALSRHAPAVKSIAAVNTAKVINTKKPSQTANSNKPIAANKTANSPVAPKKTARKTGVGAATTGILASTANNTKILPVTNNRKGSRQVQKLTIAQHFIHTSATQGYIQFDTISQETITQEYDLAENNYQPTPFGPPPYDQPAVPVNNHAVVTIDSRENNLKNKKSNSASTIENLSAAFNDMKNKVSGVHFATGLTAGINGTFFGPSSFKGFQFGMTGTFTFSENFSVMSELKYVHRINNDYSLYDNYYSYTPNPTGGYTKELVDNPYSFSTLHSIELPISARYCVGNFNFFVGANFVYTFSINTGAYPLPDPTTATQVAAIGNDNAPKLAANDFDSRFGVGYLFGLSYQVSPNVMMDFRNVQTVWDNANSAGAKIISNQLYKSPSLQLSIGYRLGGNKTKDRE